LRIAVDSNPGALDPATADAAMARRVLPMVFETLITVDRGGLQPGLATAWERLPTGAWRIQLRRGVRLHDGSLLEPGIVAAAVKTRLPLWSITPGDGAITIEPGANPADVPWALALRKNAIVVRQPGALLGTGPFRLDQRAATHVRLAAFDGYWNGRPFADAIDVRFERPTPPGQAADLEAGRLDIASARPADVRRSAQRQLRTFVSQPVDLVVVAVEPDRVTDLMAPVLRTMAAAFDRQAIARVVAQGHAEPATTLLPAWIGGYVLPPRQGRVLSRANVAALPVRSRTLVLRVPADDPVLRAVAERLVVDAQQAGITLTLQVPEGRVTPRADARLLRVAVDVTSPERALAGVLTPFTPRMAMLVGVSPAPGAPVEEVVRVESALAEQHVLVPIVHLPEIVAVAPGVDGWSGPLVGADGSWNLADAWLRAAEPAPR
jgi:peptide/nickel transport system substrate-binding protein